MITASTFYLSQLLHQKIESSTGEVIGRVKDVIADISAVRPRITALKVSVEGEEQYFESGPLTFTMAKGKMKVNCEKIKVLTTLPETSVFLAKHLMDKQIVDIHDRKVERVNDLRLAFLSGEIFVVAVDVGVEGFMRRLGVSLLFNRLLQLFGKRASSRHILWDEVETINFPRMGIKLAKPYSKLSNLHSSDLADIIEDLDNHTQAEIFASLDEEKAADVLEELEKDAQRNVLDSLSLEKAADMLEKMPADEVADILEELHEEKAEKLLEEMEEKASAEVRELMEYPENSVGSLMTTDYISFKEKLTVDETLKELRRLKPESDTIYYLYVLDDTERLVATVSLRDIVISDPALPLHKIMCHDVIFVRDTDKIDILTDIIAKYSLLALPVVDDGMKMVGMVIIDDIVFNLLKTRRRRL